MRSTPETGGPAFPMYESNVEGHIYSTADGITMRDYFAAKAMQELLGADRYSGVIGVNNYEHQVAKLSYTMADAMLEARK